MIELKFTKMHGIGNDFVVVDGITETLPDLDLPNLAIALNNRKTGIGGDGLIFISKGSNDSLKMRMFNPDGSEAEMCGNGIRCVAKLARERRLTDLNPIPIETGAGLLKLLTQDSDGDGLVDAVQVDMGIAKLLRKEIPMKGDPNGTAIGFPITVGSQEFVATAVSMGNPHCVIFVPDVTAVPLETWGPSIERHELFPNRTNTHFVQVVSRTELRMRTWERGAGPTLACGTGACAVAVAAVENGLCNRECLVHLPGGDLTISYSEDRSVRMTGPAKAVFEGVWIG